MSKHPKKQLEVFYGHTASVGGAYYRCMMYALEMKKQGIALPTYIDWNPDKMGQIPNCWEREKLSDPKYTDQIVNQLNAMVRQSDITVYQYFATPMGLALLRMQQDTIKKPILMELDDYAFDIPSLNPSSETFTPESEPLKVVKNQLKLSDGVIVSTPWLKEQYSKFNKCVELIPNCVDFDIWDHLKPGKTGKKLRIGHIGASGHLDDKQILKDVIPEILNKYDVEFCFVGDIYYPTWMTEYVKDGRIKIIGHWENIKRYPQYFKNLHFDIGLAPLKDYSFNRGKSNLRYLDYSAVRIPTVASHVRPFVDTIRDGENGYLAVEAEEWVDKISRLIVNPLERETMARKAYFDCKENYNLKIVAQQYVKVLERFVKEKR